MKRELATFVEEEAAEVEALGVAAAEARRRARLKLGNEERIREELWRQNSMTWLDSLARDARFAARSLRRSPAFAIVAILVMTLGIGANVALYAVVRGVLLRPLPYAQPQQLVAIYETVSLPGYVFDGGNRFMPVAGGSFGAWRDALAGPRPMAELSLVSPGQQYNLSSRAGGAGAAGQL
ncbi:MAG TPA: ABC transporter permease, partial [Terriglobales bacterium]